MSKLDDALARCNAAKTEFETLQFQTGEPHDNWIGMFSRNDELGLAQNDILTPEQATRVAEMYEEINAKLRLLIQHLQNKGQ